MRSALRDHYWGRIIRHQKTWEGRFWKMIKQYFQELQDHILSRLDKVEAAERLAEINRTKGALEKDSRVGALQTLLLFTEAEKQKLSERAQDLFEAMMEEVGAKELRGIGATIDFDLLDPNVLEWIKDKTLKFSDTVLETTQNQLKEQLLQSIMAGESIEQIKDRVREVFSGTVRGTAPRARLIARTETISAFNAARWFAHRQSRIVEAKEWLTAKDERVRPTHVAADGQRVGITEKFVVGGHLMDFPGDPTAPPQLICNCRCTIIPIIAKEVTLPEEVPEGLPFNPQELELIDEPFGEFDVHVFRDKEGGEWEFTVPIVDVWAHRCYSVNQMRKLLGLPHEEAYLLEMNLPRAGKRFGYLAKRMEKDFLSNADLGSLSPEQIQNLQKELILDWLLGDLEGGGCPERFYISSDGELVAHNNKSDTLLRTIWNDLNVLLDPPEEWEQNWYVEMFQRYASGEKIELADLRSTVLSSFLRNLEELDDDKLKEAVIPYLKSMVDYGEISHYEADSLIEELLRRKQTVRGVVEDFYKEVEKRRKRALSRRTGRKKTITPLTKTLWKEVEESEHSGRMIFLKSDKLENMAVRAYTYQNRLVLEGKLLGHQGYSFMNWLEKVEGGRVDQVASETITIIGRWGKKLKEVVDKTGYTGYVDLSQDSNYQKIRELARKGFDGAKQVEDEIMELAEEGNQVPIQDLLTKVGDLGYKLWGMCREKTIGIKKLPSGEEIGIDWINTVPKIRPLQKRRNIESRRIGTLYPSRTCLLRDEKRGIEMEYFGGETGTAHMNMFTVEIENNGLESLKTALDFLQDLGLHQGLATEEDMELLYLIKASYASDLMDWKDGERVLSQDRLTRRVRNWGKFWMLLERKKTTEEKINFIREYWRKNRGYDPVKAKNYDPMPKFHEGNKGWFRLQRFILPDEEEDYQDLKENYRIVHCLFKTLPHREVESIVEMFKETGSLLSNFFRGAMGLSDVSLSDVGTGGANFVFTQLFKRSYASTYETDGYYGRKGAYFVLDPDVITDWNVFVYGRDVFGNTKTVERVFENRCLSIQEILRATRNRDNEVLVPLELPLLPYLKQIVVTSMENKHTLVKQLKEMGITEIGGSPLEEAIVVKLETERWKSPSNRSEQ